MVILLGLFSGVGFASSKNIGESCDANDRANHPVLCATLFEYAHGGLCLAEH